MTDREIDALIAEKVFGLEPCDGWTPTGSPFFGMAKNCSNNREDEHNCYPRDFAPFFTTNAEASKSVRVKLAEVWNDYSLNLVSEDCRTASGEKFEFSVRRIDVKTGTIQATCFEVGDTEEMAVAKTALKTVGVEL